MKKRALSVTMFFLLAMIMITAALYLQNALAGELKMIKGQTVYVPVAIKGTLVLKQLVVLPLKFGGVSLLREENSLLRMGA